MPLLEEVQPVIAPPAARAAGPARPRVRLGEELPIFCERCGYSLHGLPQARCERCAVLHYACPECNHHQPINTLRPAAQRMLGRIRAFTLGFWVLVKINFFGWLLFAWFVMGTELSYQTHWMPRPVTTQPATLPSAPTPSFGGPPLEADTILPVVLFALPFAMVGRMLLLRWRRGWAVGFVLAALVGAILVLGGVFRAATLSRWGRVGVPPLSAEYFTLVASAAGAIVVGALAVWPAWMAVVHLFLPQKTALALLDWQRGLSGKEPPLARE
jgi:hypothetical protein